MKTAPINKVLRKSNLVVNALGIRAQESDDRARKPALKIHPQISTERIAESNPERAYEKWRRSGERGRFALSWNPLYAWTLDEVWRGTLVGMERESKWSFQNGRSLASLEDSLSTEYDQLSLFE